MRCLLAFRCTVAALWQTYGRRRGGLSPSSAISDWPVTASALNFRLPVQLLSTSLRTAAVSLLGLALVALFAIRRLGVSFFIVVRGPVAAVPAEMPSVRGILAATVYGSHDHGCLLSSVLARQFCNIPQDTFKRHRKPQRTLLPPPCVYANPKTLLVS